MRVLKRLAVVRRDSRGGMGQDAVAAGSGTEKMCGVKLNNNIMNSSEGVREKYRVKRPQINPQQAGLQESRRKGNKMGSKTTTEDPLIKIRLISIWVSIWLDTNGFSGGFHTNTWVETPLEISQ
ncbi:uncharacterized protein PGTG_11017 [Puccinia graminis f. sp. tritici CRL 75-36-700-3]|uniref:Uncharacterized protein n=1 Tax=Puccinia graminis f. sp. tritici (strain CRL 75-36-700-3 / race SCCL) TaxID=418459 RepID=E3KN52_PUCGT|nr:uncharacterized protein PGTG_11017 [Puccinia graminis f. sp. tritici CRL 75-36-700-3]EFP85688.1 hypothetical protein PGTG_11017 [Puccinia graminis f. sp. tritici CRL 75-36-700-3]